MSGRYRPEHQVKQYVAVVRGRLGEFMVFATGSDRHYVFAQLYPPRAFDRGGRPA